MVKEFLTPEQDPDFKNWMVQHPHGYYLNETSVGSIKRGEGTMMMHKVGCHHLGTGEGVISTTYAKAASEDINHLKSWAQGKGLAVVACSSCKPE